MLNCAKNHLLIWTKTNPVYSVSFNTDCGKSQGEESGSFKMVKTLQCVLYSVSRRDVRNIG